MAANVRYRGTYYGTTTTGTGDRTMKVEILDTEEVAQVINVQVTFVDDSFEGLSEDLRPGIFPSSLRVGIAIRSTPVTINGKTYGTNSDLIEDILEAPEGRFLLRLLIDDELEFIGPMIYDQCSYEDMSHPFELSITAVDGLVRLSSEEYVSEVGQIVYKDCKSVEPDEWTETPYTGCVTGSEWVVVEVQVHQHESNEFYVKTTTVARRQIYAKDSPGTGWVDQGLGLWAKEVTYTNEIETNPGPNFVYHMTRDIDDERHRTIAEYFRRGMAATAMTDEYPDPDVMYDVNMIWYEHSMANFTDDPSTMIRLPEIPLIGKTWADAFQEIARLYHLRIYSSKGIYHFEQIPSRTEATVKRWQYKADGTSAGAAVEPDLDLDLADLEIQPETGGTFKFLAPFSYVEAVIRLDASDLLANVRWDVGQMGVKYLGRIKRSTGTQIMTLQLRHSITSTFDPSVLTPLNPNVVNSLCKHVVRTFMQVRLTNVETGAVYYLTEDGNSGVWDTDPYTYERVTSFGTSGTIFSATDFGHTKRQIIMTSSDNIPDPEGTMYDVHMSLTFAVEWDNTNAFNLWENQNTDKHWHVLSSDYYSPGDTFGLNSMKFASDIDPWTEHPDTVAQEKVYWKKNETANTLKVRVETQWADTNQFEKSIQIWNGTIWVNSKAWSVNGEAETGVELLTLLVEEIMSLRETPRRLYSGSFVTSLPRAENRLLRGTDYYLPLSCSRDTAGDTYGGEFMEIASTTPSGDGGVVGSPIDGTPLPGVTGIGDNEPDSPTPDIDITLETNEAITASATLTEIDIVNTAEAFIQAGTSITIMHPVSGVVEVVILAEDINPDSTTMTIEEHTFGFSFPDASLIIPNVDDGLMPTTLAQYFYFYKENYSASAISAPNYNFPDPEGYGAQNINKRVKMFRNGIRIFYNGAPGNNPTKRKQSYYYDHVAKEWKFWIPLSGETIEIEAF